MFMTPSEKALLDDAISHLSGYPLHPETRKIQAMAYIKLFRQEHLFERTPDAIVLANMIRFKEKAQNPAINKEAEERQKQMMENTAGLNKTYAAVRELLNIYSPAGQFRLDDLLSEIYSHPDCVAYYKTEAGLWLMTNVISHCLSQYVSEHKHRIFSEIMKENLNGIADTINKKEF